MTKAHIKHLTIYLILTFIAAFLILYIDTQNNQAESLGAAITVFFLIQPIISFFCGYSAGKEVGTFPIMYLMVTLINIIVTAIILECSAIYLVVPLIIYILANILGSIHYRLKNKKYKSKVINIK